MREWWVCNVRFEEWRLDSIWPVDLLARCLTGHRRAGHRIVFTNGCFDVLHRGHVECLQQAASLGDVLVVGVNSDQTVHRLKGAGRPVIPAEDRAALVAAIGCVEYVTIFDDDSPIRLLEAVRPDIYVKGGDYDAETLPERLAVECYGGRVVTVGYLPGRSTTSIVERVRSGGELPPVAADQVHHLYPIGTSHITGSRRLPAGERPAGRVMRCAGRLLIRGAAGRLTAIPRNLPNGR